MKKKIKNFMCILAMLTLLPILNSCNNEDDVITIFVGKTWKLSFIAAEGTYEQFDFWNGNEEARKKSMDALKATNFILNFEGTDLNGIAGGVFNGRAISTSIDGQWSADGKSQELSLTNIKTTGSDSDALAKAFIYGIQNAFKYKGDANNLFIYYKEGQTTKRIGLKPIR